MGIPLPALQARVPEPSSPLQSYARALAVRGLLQQGERENLSLEREKQLMNDQELIRKAFQESGGDITKALDTASVWGASPEIILKLRTSHAAELKSLSDLQESQFKNVQSAFDVIGRNFKAVKDAPPDWRPYIYQQGLQDLQKSGIDVSKFPAQYPGDEILPLLDAQIGMSKSLVDEALRSRQAKVGERQAAVGERQVATAEQRLALEEGELASMTPEQRRLYKANETQLATLEAQGDPVAKTALGILRKHKIAITAAEAYARAKAQTEAMMSGFGAGAGGGATPGVSIPTGEAFLNSLDPGVATQVKALAEGRMQFPGSFALRSPYWMQMLKLVGQYDPTFDASQWNVRNAVRKDFTAGKSSQNIRSLNTAIGHLASLKKAAEGLKNADAPLWNAISNYGLTQIGDPRVVRFNTAKNAVAGEAATVFKGTSGTDQEIKAWNEQLSSSQSPQQIESSINQIIELLGSRLSAIDSRWQTGMKRARDFRILDKKSAEVLRSLPGGESLIDDDSAGMIQGGGAGAAPPPQHQVGESRQYQGSTYVFDGQQWVRQ